MLKNINGKNIALCSALVLASFRPLPRVNILSYHHCLILISVKCTAVRFGRLP